MMSRIIFLTLVLLFVTPLAEALFIETNLTYLSDNLTYTATNTTARTVMDFTFGPSIDSKKIYQVGWSILSATLADSINSTDYKYTTLDMGIKFGVNFGKGREWGFAVAYYLQTKAQFAVGGATAEDWRGTALKAEFGYTPQISESSFLGLRFNYYAPAIKEAVTNQTSLATVSYSRAMIYPSLYYRIEY